MNYREEAINLKDYIVKHRRHIHQHPELSFEEKETTAYLKKELESMGVAVQCFDDYNGLVATIKGGKPGKTVLLRADIDALPIEEQADVDYPSLKKGVMHACGHDAHTAMLLGAAKLLQGHSSELAGTVKLLFQAAEESGHGSKYYVDNNIVTDADACFALHVMPQVPAGKIVLDPGPRMAACIDFVATIEGKSAHGSTPHLGNDAIVAASSAIMNIQTLVSRINNPIVPLVVSIGKIRAGKQFNIICDKAVLDGTMRTFDYDTYKMMPKRFEQILQNAAEMYNCTSHVEYLTDEPAADNCHPELLAIAQKAATELWGEDVLAHTERMMGSEDFSMIMDKVPGVLGFLGVGDEKAIYTLHNEKFNLNDGNLYLGAGLYAQFAADYLLGGDANA